MLSRRALCRSFWGGLALNAAARALRSDTLARLADGLWLDSPSAPGSVCSRSYRADAVIALLGVPVLTRQNVGHGVATMRESTDRGSRFAALHFAGASNPEAAHGIHYCGSSDERVVEHESTLVEAAYFGFVTSAATESYEKARQRVLAGNPSLCRYAVIEGRHAIGKARYERASIEMTWQDRSDLAGLARTMRAQFSAAVRTLAELNLAGSRTAPTFLYSVFCAIRSSETKFACSYVHNARQYHLQCEKSPDAHMGAMLAAKNLVEHTQPVTRLTGQIREAASGHASTFRLWVHDQSVLPLRIEFQPRSYLRISLEYAPRLEISDATEEKI